MHGTDVNTKFVEKQIGGEGKSLFCFASDLETVGAHLTATLSCAGQAAASGNDSIALTMFECAERYVGDLDAITKTMYEQSRQAKSAAPVTSVAEAGPTPIKIKSIPYAAAAVDVASLGMCCIDQITTFLDVIHELATVDGLNEAARAKRIDSIRGISKLAIRLADDLHNTIDCERENLEEQVNALREAGHV